MRFFETKPIYSFMYTNKEIWNVTYPIFLGLLAQNVINVTDTAFLGHVSEVALGASAMGGLLYICFYTVAFGFSVGSQILIARRNGEGNFHAIGPIMWQGSAFSLGMAVVLLGAMYLFAEPLIRLLITSDNVYHATYEFFIWRIWGFLFAFVNVMFRALYIGITQTKVLTMSAVVMAAVNVVLDYVLVFGEWGFPEMGVRGAALASVIAEASSLAFYLIYTYTKVDLHKYALHRFGRFDWNMVGRILHISSFTMVQYFLSMAIWFVFFMALERLGERQLAIANGGVSKVVHLLNRIARMSFYIMVVCVALCVIFPHSILSVYTNETALLDESVMSLYVICGSMLIASFAFVYFNGISGTGNTQAALVLEIGVQVFYALYIIVVGMVIQAPVEVCFTTEVIYYTLMLAFSLLYLKKAKWQNKKI